MSQKYHIFCFSCACLCLLTHCNATKPTPVADVVQPQTSPINRPASPPQPIVAPDGVWTWVPVDGALCGDGSATGFAVSLKQASTDLVVLFEGGGECYDYTTCNVLKTASYVTTGYTESTFNNTASEEPALNNKYFISNRLDPNNPFPTANMAYIPYCTGDLHAGNNITTYMPATQPTYHVGAKNVALYLQRLLLTMPAVQHIWLVGDSAGGFGAVLNRDQVQQAFTQAQIDIIDDSGIAFAGYKQPSSWKLTLPSDCNCDSDFSQLLVYYANKYPKNHISFLSYAADSELPYYLGMSPLTFATDLGHFVQDNYNNNNLHYFIVAGSNHVVLKNSSVSVNNLAVTTWMNQMITGGPLWINDVPLTN